MTTITVTLELEVNERAWAQLYGAGDAYDMAEAQGRRSLVADVRDYAHTQLMSSAAASEGAITDVDLVDETPKPKGRKR